MLFQVKGHWFMVAPKPNPKAAKRVSEKLDRRECLIEDCKLPMEVCGCCRPHYDAAEKIISRQPTDEDRERAREKLIRAGLLLDRWKQPRKFSQRSKAAIFRAALAT